jgi:threonine dehydratase
MIAATSNLFELAAGAPLAAALALRERLAGSRIALVGSGGNISLPQLRALLEGAGAG